MKRYFLISFTTMYDGLEFHDKRTMERDIPKGKKINMKEIEKECKKFDVHEDTGEILDSFWCDEMTKAEYDVLKKYHI